MQDCLYNRRSTNFKAKWRPSRAIQENLRNISLVRRNLPMKSNEECSRAFIALKTGFEDTWFLDSFCTRHMPNRCENLYNYFKKNSHDCIYAACQGGNMNMVGI